jgi:hypothetical protein
VSDFGFVAAVTGVFFLFGVAFGVLAVIAASALRGDSKRASRKRTDTGSSAGWTSTGWSGGWTDTIAARWEEPPEVDENGEENGPPTWPGGPSGR